MNNFGVDPQVKASLLSRNANIADFWLSDPDTRIQAHPKLMGKSALVVDAEDCFTAMLTQQLTALGLNTQRCRFNDDIYLDPKWDLIVMGPGPGDPHSVVDRRIVAMHSRIVSLLKRNKAFIAVCLSHQILCLELGLPVVKRKVPNQGVQREIDLFGSPQLVGFYNTFCAQCEHDNLGLAGHTVEVCRDAVSGEVHAMRSSKFVSIQFHAESLLTQHGVNILRSSVERVLGL